MTSLTDRDEFVLTKEEFYTVLRYFEDSLTALSDEEQTELVFREGPIRDMLREIKQEQEA
jgi:hypothetical protein